MKRLVLSVLAAASLTAVAAPALAQPYGPPPPHAGGPGWGGPGPGGPGGGINEREAQISDRIDQGERRGGITRGEAYRLRGELRGIQDLQFRYRRNGLTGWERNDLNRRLDALSARVFDQRHDDDRRGHGGGGWRH